MLQYDVAYNMIYYYMRAPGRLIFRPGGADFSLSAGVGRGRRFGIHTLLLSRAVASR